MTSHSITSRPLPENKFVTPEMMAAWGYPDSSDSREIIIRAHDLENAGHINSIRVAKNWVRGELPRPGGTFLDYMKINFNNSNVDPAALPPISSSGIPDARLRAALNKLLNRGPKTRRDNRFWENN